MMPFVNAVDIRRLQSLIDVQLAFRFLPLTSTIVASDSSNTKESSNMFQVQQAHNIMESKACFSMIFLLACLSMLSVQKKK